MSNEDKPYLFEVMASLPPTETQRWRGNVTVHVVTFSVERAIELVRERWPEEGVQIHKAERRNYNAHAIIDPAAVS